MLRLFTFVIVAVAFIYAIDGFSFKPSTTDSIGKTCRPVDCGGKVKHCQYGYRKQDGCEICKCHDPCNPPGRAMLCGANKKCFVDKTHDGTFIGRCIPLRSKRNDKACKQRKAVGSCSDTLKRFYYNSITNRCEKFIYKGCGGNDNNFETKRHCETTCVA